MLAELLNSCIDPTWIIPRNTALVVIPARKQAIRERGFDHMKEVGKRLSAMSDLPLLDILAPNERSDQRGLSASSRQKNMRNSFVPKPLKQVNRTNSAAESTDIPANVILVDDVLTTGATLIAGALTLKEMGAQRVFGLTVARLP